MNIHSIISTCDAMGISFALKGEKLVVKGKESVVAEMSPILQEYKAALRDYLVNQPTITSTQVTNLPSPWAEAFTRMNCMPKPTKLSPTSWQAILDATGRLLDSHLPALIKHGWQVEDVFSCHATAPEHNYSVMGLVFLMADKEITHIDADAITLKTSGGAIQRYRKPQHGYLKVMVWELG